MGKVGVHFAQVLGQGSLQQLMNHPLGIVVAGIQAGCKKPPPVPGQDLQDLCNADV